MPGWVGSIYRERIHGQIPAGTYGKNLAWNASLKERDRYLDSLSFFPALHRERDLFTVDFLRRAAALPDRPRRIPRFLPELVALLVLVLAAGAFATYRLGTANATAPPSSAIDQAYSFPDETALPALSPQESMSCQ